MNELKAGPSFSAARAGESRGIRLFPPEGTTDITESHQVTLKQLCGRRIPLTADVRAVLAAEVFDWRVWVTQEPVLPRVAETNFNSAGLALTKRDAARRAG